MQKPPRALLALLGLPLLIGSCVGGDAPTGVGGGPARLALALQPALIASPANGSALPVNRIRTLVVRQPDGTALREAHFDVSPTAASWSIDVEVPVSEQPIDVVVYVYLIHVSGDGTQDVQFSGRTPEPLNVSAGDRLTGVDVDLVRGPIANLSVTGVTITSFPDTLASGASGPMSATATTSGSATPEVFWMSLDTAVLTTSDSVATGVSPGMAQVVASAGAHTDTVSILVIAAAAAVDSVRVSPDSADVQAGQTRTYTAQLFDASGNVLAGPPPVWTTGNASIATVNQSGVVLGVTPGTTTVRATSDGVFDEAVVRVTAAPVGGATITWTNAGSGDWSTASNWSLNRVPAAGDTVVVEGNSSTVTVDVNPTISRLVVRSTGEPVTLNVGDHTLSITGTSSAPELDIQLGSIVSIGGGEIIVADIANRGSIIGTSSSGLQTQLLLNEGELHVTTGTMTVFHDVSSTILMDGDILVDLGAAFMAGENVEMLYEAGTIGGPGLVLFTAGSELSLGANLSIDATQFFIQDADVLVDDTESITIGVDAAMYLQSTADTVEVEADVLVQGVLFASGPATVLTGDLIVASGAFVLVEGSVQGGARFETRDVDNSGTIALSGDADEVTFGPGAAGGSITNRLDGIIETLAGGLTILDGELLNEGDVYVLGPTELRRTDAAGAPVAAQHLNTGTIELFTGGDLIVVLGGTDPTITNSGVITVGVATTLAVSNLSNGQIISTVGAILQGAGTVDFTAGNPFGINNGEIRPGLSFAPGNLTWIGSVPMGPGGIIVLDIEGTVPGVEYDQFHVSNQLFLNGNGAVDVQFPTLFVPEDGDRFAVLTFGTRVGDFATVNLPTIPGLTVSTEWTDNAAPDTLFVVATASSPPPANLNRWVSAVSGDWSTASNWSKDAVPVPGDSVVINALGTYTVTLSSAAAVSSLTIGRSGSTPTLELTGTGHALSVTGSFTNDGIIELRDDSTNGVPMLLDAQSGFTNGFDGIVAAMSTGDISQIDGEIDNFGTIWTQSQGLIIPPLPDVTHDNYGMIEAAGGNIIIQLSPSGGSFNNFGHLLIRSTRVINIDGGTSASSGTIEGEGSLTLTGTTFSNNGQINPGVLGTGSTGVFAINGSSTWGAASVLNLELGGLTPGAHDQLVNSGAVTLDGVLFVAISGFTPQIGDSLAVMTFVGRSGNFADVFLPTVSGVTLDTVWAEAGVQDTLYLVASAAVGGIAADWTFDESSGQVALDFMGQGNHGQLGTTPGVDIADPSWQSFGRVGYALTFVGTQVVGVPDAASLEPATMTVEAFVRASAPGVNRYVVSKGGGPTSADNAAFGLYTGPSGGLSFYTSVNGGSTFYQTDDAGAVVWDAIWHHVAGTFDGSMVRLFVDGTEVGTANAALLGYETPQGDLAIGALDPTGFSGFIGNIDEVRIWSRVLTQAEIAARAARGAP